MLKKFLATGFYFSYNYDLTSSRQRLSMLKQQSIQNQSLSAIADSRYFWNYNICQDFLTNRVDSSWILPVIQGYVGYSQLPLQRTTLEMLLICRRRWPMPGTRFKARGIDDEGNVANFVESEQIIIHQDYVLSAI